MNTPKAVPVRGIRIRNPRNVYEVGIHSFEGPRSVALHHLRSFLSGPQGELEALLDGERDASIDACAHHLFSILQVLQDAGWGISVEVVHRYPEDYERPSCCTNTPSLHVTQTSPTDQDEEG